MQRMDLKHGDAVEVLPTLSEDNQRPHVVYLDPMYPPRAHVHSALPRKEMNVLRLRVCV